MNQDQSIHPRVVNGRTMHKKVNTCAKRNPNRKGRLAKASNALDIRRRDWNSTMSSLRAPTPGVYTQPGSMKS